MCTGNVRELCVHWLDDDGTEYEACGQTLESLSARLREQDHHGNAMRVVDEYGNTIGWVSGHGWRDAE